MSIWTNTGKLVVNGSGKVITCNTCPCGEAFCDCIPDSLIVDVGAGGWVDEDCDYCDQVTGQFTLAKTSEFSAETYCEATYYYEECPVCEELCPDRHAGFRIVASVTYTIATDTYSISIAFRIESNNNDTALCFSKDDATDSTFADATYVNASIVGPTPLVISRTSNTHQAWGGATPCPGLQVCTGTLAATVSVEFGACDPDPPGFALPAALAFMNMGNGFEFVAAGNAEFLDVLSLT
jgi:hypothetical protein